jgi:hypothetical protein
MLLSLGVDPEHNLSTYAQSAARVPTRTEGEKALAKAAFTLSFDLANLTEEFNKNSQALDDQETVVSLKHAYSILFPDRTAVSILL